MKVTDLEAGKFYGCLLTNRPILIVKTKEVDEKGENEKEITVGLMGRNNMTDSGERQIGYNRVTLYDGQLAELNEQPKLNKNKTK